MMLCQNICLNDERIWNSIEELLYPQDLNVRQALIETKLEIEQTASLLANMYLMHKSMVKVCEAY